MPSLTLWDFVAFWHTLCFDIYEEPDLHKNKRDEKAYYHIDPRTPDSLTIVLRALLGRDEYQDIAVFTVQKLHRKRVMIQLIGDVALYGRNYVIEPVITKKRNQRLYADPVYAENITVINNYYWDIFDWPIAVFICHQQSSQVNHRIAEGSYRETYSRPDQRVEGAELYNRTRTSTGNESRRTDESRAAETRRNESKKTSVSRID